MSDSDYFDAITDAELERCRKLARELEAEGVPRDSAKAAAFFVMRLARGG